MTARFATCPKCQHQRAAGESADPGTCPACGLIFAKWMARSTFVPPSRQRIEEDDTEEADESMATRLVATLTHVPEKVDPLSFWGRVAVLALMVVWGWKLTGYDYREGEIASSLMHPVLLIIHEAGHIIFMPFGEFMTVLGGSLFQLLMPLIVAGTLLLQNRDPIGGALGLWWCGTSLLDLAPYIYDASAPQLMLITGKTGADGPHDWIYLLEVFNRITYGPAYGRFTWQLGIVVMLAAIAWAAWILLKQKQRLASGGAGMTIE
jgi:hypothetical protein